MCNITATHWKWKHVDSLRNCFDSRVRELYHLMISYQNIQNFVPADKIPLRGPGLGICLKWNCGGSLDGTVAITFMPNRGKDKR